MEITPALLYDCIYPPKSKAGDLAKLKWALFQNLYAGRAELLIYFQCRLGSNLKRCQPGHNSLEHTVFCIRSFDVLQFTFRNAPDLQQPLRLVFQNIQCVHTEPLHNVCGSFGTNPFDKPGGKEPSTPFFVLGTISRHCSTWSWTPYLPFVHSPSSSNSTASVRGISYPTAVKRIKWSLYRLFDLASAGTL